MMEAETKPKIIHAYEQQIQEGCVQAISISYLMIKSEHFTFTDHSFLLI